MAGVPRFPSPPCIHCDARCVRLGTRVSKKLGTLKVFRCTSCKRTFAEGQAERNMVTAENRRRKDAMAHKRTGTLADHALRLGYTLTDEQAAVLAGFVPSEALQQRRGVTRQRIGQMRLSGQLNTLHWDKVLWVRPNLEPKQLKKRGRKPKPIVVAPFDVGDEEISLIESMVTLKSYGMKPLEIRKALQLAVVAGR